MTHELAALAAHLSGDALTRLHERNGNLVAAERAETTLRQMGERAAISEAQPSAPVHGRSMTAAAPAALQRLAQSSTQRRR